MIMGSQTDKDGLLVFHHAWKGGLRAFWTVGALGQNKKPNAPSPSILLPICSLSQPTFILHS